MAKRMYLVHLTRKKVLVESTSQEAAIRAATAQMVRSCTIPTALEVAKMMSDEAVEKIIPSLGPTPEKPTANPAEGDADGVGRLGIGEPHANNIDDCQPEPGQEPKDD